VSGMTYGSKHNDLVNSFLISGSGKRISMAGLRQLLRLIRQISKNTSDEGLKITLEGTSYPQNILM